MSASQVVIAKADCTSKLESPYIIFDMCWNELNSPASVVKLMKDKKKIKEEINEFLKNIQGDSGKGKSASKSGESTHSVDFKKENLTKI